MKKDMTQVKFTLEMDIVNAFRIRCEKAGVSMTSVVRNIMKTIKPNKEVKPGMLTRPMRRKSVAEIISLLQDIMDLEADYREAIPEQFEQRIEAAEHACEQLAEAVACLKDAF